SDENLEVLIVGGKRAILVRYPAYPYRVAGSEATQLWAGIAAGPGEKHGQAFGLLADQKQVPAGILIIIDNNAFGGYQHAQVTKRSQLGSPQRSGRGRRGMADAANVLGKQDAFSTAAGDSSLAFYPTAGLQTRKAPRT